jgi:HAD superfamily hydrolase (TIGR01458 family)
VAIRAVLLDIEGTLIDPAGPIAGAVAAVGQVHERGLALRYVTNVDSQPPGVVAQRLRDNGFPCTDAELFTPVAAVRQLLGPAARVRLLVSPALRASLADLATDPPYTHVVIGDCGGELDYAALDGAFRAVEAGAELLALQRGRYFQRADGNHLDAGALVAAVEYAAGATARVLGKPSHDFFALALASVGCAAADAVMVGDDATSDIAGAAAAGLHTVRVRTGKYAGQTAAGVTTAAEATIDSVADLPTVLGRL